MKHLRDFTLLAFAILLIACNNKEGGTAASDTTRTNSSNEDMIKSNREVYRAIETGDTATLRKYIASDAVDHGGGPNGEDVKGEELIRMLATFHNDIDNLKFEPIEEAANDDHIFTLVRMTGTTNKPIWGMPANFKLDNRSIDLIKVRDGKMVDHWGFFEVAEVMKMMNHGGQTSGAGSRTEKDTTR